MNQTDTYIYTVFKSGYVGGTSPITVDIETARADIMSTFIAWPEFLGIVVTSEKLSEGDLYAAMGKI